MKRLSVAPLDILPAWIIEEELRRRQEDDSVRPRLELPVPELLPEPEQEEKPTSTVIIIPL